MTSPLPIIRARRVRRESSRRQAGARLRRLGVGCGALASIFLALFFLGIAFSWRSLTRDLPSPDSLPVLLSPPNGILLQPTRIYDRNGEHLLKIFAPQEGVRHYLPLNPRNPHHLPQSLADAVLSISDPHFWTHAGYDLQGIQNPDAHPTLAQTLAAELLLWDEPPSLRRAIRERILAAEITERYGRQQVLEWYLNSANFGRDAYGADAAARLYFGKSADELTLAESAELAAIAAAPALNPLDAPEAAYQRRQDVLDIMAAAGVISPEEAEAAKQTPHRVRTVEESDSTAPAFLRLLLAQLAEEYPLERIRRGGLTIFSTLDYDLQQQVSCLLETQIHRLAGKTAYLPAGCDAAAFLPPLSPNETPFEARGSLVVLDASSGEILALVGETSQEGETSLFETHRSGTTLLPFLYLSAFSRGFSPASMIWDIPLQTDIQNLDGLYHGPVRLRTALANDYLVPAAQVMEQVGEEHIRRTFRLFGFSFDPEASLLDESLPLSPLDAAWGYAVFAAEGKMEGQIASGGAVHPSALRVVEENVSRLLWLDWRVPQEQSVVSPQLAYLMNNVLSDDTARWPSLGYPNPLDIGRPAAAKLGETRDRRDAWTIGYTPQRVVAVWLGGEDAFSPLAAAGVWHAAILDAVNALPPEGWDMPLGITELSVCDPSGLLPTEYCPNIVNEVFLEGNEPLQADTLYRAYQVNRETGLLATVFTPPELVESRVYMNVPPEARAWAKDADIPAPPDAYDAILPPPPNPDAEITAPNQFAFVHGVLQILGTAGGEGFSYYRLQVGRGINPQTWEQLGEDVSSPVTNGVLGEWDASNESGLFAIRLLVVRQDQRVDSATVQVTVDNDAPIIRSISPSDGETVTVNDDAPLPLSVEAEDEFSIDSVKFYLDSRFIGEAVEAPYVWYWIPPKAGRYTLLVVARDGAGNVTQKSISFIVER